MKKFSVYFLLSILALLLLLLVGCEAAEEEVESPTRAAELVEEEEPEVEEEPEEEIEDMEDVEEGEEPAAEAEENPTSTNFSEEELAELEQFILETMEQDQIAGAAVALIDGSETVWAKGFGLQDVADETPVTTETLFHIASTQKSMTSFMIATLVDEGVVEWDTPVVEYDPDFELADEESTNSVTLRHLLTMTSGIHDEDEDEFDPYESYAEDLYEYLPQIDLSSAPGEVHNYSNIAVSVAAYVGVAAVGEEYEDLYTAYQELFVQKVLEPIGMNDVVFLYSDALENPNYGHSYQLDGDEWVEAETEDVDSDPLAPSGYIKANVLDMAKFISTQINEGVAPNGNQVVSAENLMETWEPTLEDYGMGWQTAEYNGFTFYVHDGYFDNYTSIIGFSPDKQIGFVVLNNSADMADNLIWGVPEKVAEFLEE